jgi:glucose/arabinose dehydrogenase/mono/diheme cytochrome c family protein
MMLSPRSVALVFFALSSALLHAAEPTPKSPKSTKAPRKAAPTNTVPLAAWVEPDFPFFSSVLDARKAGVDLAPDNLTPRGLVLNLGHDLWVCFDVDLLRVAAIWRGPGVTAKALAPGSYHDVTRKTPGGQTQLPEPEGVLWLANGIYPGAQTGSELALADPRPRAPSPEEVGRGALPETHGRFEAIRMSGNTATLEYTVRGTRIREQLSAAIRDGAPVVTRRFTVDAGTQPLVFAAGIPVSNIQAHPATGDSPAVTMQGRVATVRVPARPAPTSFALEITPDRITSKPSSAITATPAARRWPQEVTTPVKLSASKDAYVVDHVALPFDNPWRRGVRPADIQFLKDGTAVLVTLDGDVWLARGLDASSPASLGAAVRWQRFASGLHEPMTIAIREEQIYAFDKNGIWRLRDTDGNGEADAHELFSNAFGQTADMREFPSQIRLAPGGEFVIAKGGQQATTLGKHNGSVLRISADGRRATLLGHGFRQPNIGVNPRTGLVTSSDQQGQYIPSTPLHIVRDDQFYGYLAEFLPREKYPEPIADPVTWIPHAVNPSAISQVWLYDAKLGPLNDSLVHIGFNKPELFRVVFNERGSRLQASVVSITRAFEFPPLNGSVNPRDGQLYLAGFQVLGWGNVLDVPAGLGRVRYTGAPVTVPREIVPTEQGVLVRFDTALDPKKATDPTSYSLQSWSYKRTYKYGSPQYKADGTPGQDALPVSAAYLSTDGRSIFIAVPDMKPVMQLRVGWSLATKDGRSFEENGYTTPYELGRFDPQAEGFGDIKIDLSRRGQVAAESTVPVTVEEGQRLAQLFACIACHAIDNAGVVRAGPTWKNLYGSKRSVFVAGKPQPVEVDEGYLREAILEPTAKIAAGYEKGEYAMPSFAGVLNASQVEALVLYIKSLK